MNDEAAIRETLRRYPEEISKEQLCRLFEIKHSSEAVSRQYRHLIDEEKRAQIEHRYGLITEKTVLYRSENGRVRGDSVPERGRASALPVMVVPERI